MRSLRWLFLQTAKRWLFHDRAYQVCEVVELATGHPRTTSDLESDAMRIPVDERPVTCSAERRKENMPLRYGIYRQESSSAGLHLGEASDA